MSSLREELGKQIKRWREHRGMSQDQLAIGADIDRQTIYRLEKGRAWPKFENIQSICKTLNIEDRMLFSDALAASADGHAPDRSSKKLRLFEIVASLDEDQASLLLPEAEALLPSRSSLIVRKARRVQSKNGPRNTD